MIRFARLAVLLGLVALVLTLPLAQAQDLRVQPGDPPVVSLIVISEPDADGLVTITGAAGAVFPAAQVAVRNLYTGDTVYSQATTTGSFTLRIYGPGNTPFWISPAPNIPDSLRNRPGSLPGGPGTIIYGSIPRNGGDSGVLVTQLAIDGLLADWSIYNGSALNAEGGSVRAILNQESLYVALERQDLPADYARMQVRFTLDGQTYVTRLNPTLPAPAELERTNPNPTVLTPLPVAVAAEESVIELRIPYLGININNPSIEEVSLEDISFLDDEGLELLLVAVAQPVPILAEADGIVRQSAISGTDFQRFSVGGVVAQEAARWTATGRINSLALQPGDTLHLELDVTLGAPELAGALTGLTLGGRLFLQPLAYGEGAIAPGGIDSNNGWSTMQTPGGLAIINQRSDVPLGEATVRWQQVIRQEESLIFPLDFELVVPADLPAGYYVPAFEGFGRVGDGETFRWDTNNLLATGRTVARETITRLPLVLNVGAVEDGHLLMSLFQDTSSAGSRGILAQEDQENAALSGRVRFEAPTFILPPFDRAGDPISYPLEPYLVHLTSNSYDHFSAPLVSFLFPGGRMTARIIRPDGEVDDLGTAVILQNRLSTDELDERIRFGAGSPLDFYRLTTLNDAFTDYIFSQYGEYTVEMSASLEDTWGHAYSGGGTYQVTIAEPVTLLPAVLSGTPLQVGDVFTPGLHLLPAIPAEVTVIFRTIPLDGSAGVNQQIRGQANRDGVFVGEGVLIESPGEYVADYEVRYTDEQGRLWAGSLRSAGVIAAGDSPLVAHGARGISEPVTEEDPAWFSTRNLLADDAVPVLQYPYFSGDVLWLPTDAVGRINPIITLQDRGGDYTQWLLANNPQLTQLERLALEDQLPVFDENGNRAYSYHSVTGPTVTARQYVQGGTDGRLDTSFTLDEAFNRQAGVGIGGALPGDYFFLFGGAVIRDATSELADAAIYAALAVIEPGSDSRGARVFPPYQGQAGGAYGGPLMTIRGEPIDIFFLPTATRPGDVLAVGETLSIAGQVGPTLASDVDVRITSPSGVIRQFSGQANPIGYFYDPAHDFTVDEAGLWTVTIRVQHTGATSAGPIEPPPPVGSVPGAINQQYAVYVIPADREPLSWNDDRNEVNIPPGQPFNFNFTMPADWTNNSVSYTVMTPGVIMESGQLRVTGRSATYQYNPGRLNENFPNLERGNVGAGPYAADLVRLSVLAQGIDANGQPAQLSRTFLITYDRLYTFR
ncbi:MAG: hypothetical protein J0M33_16535 [Anaerolineae bacterium]|nr:hypothetical protein [Anaerolineae bacterium]